MQASWSSFSNLHVDLSSYTFLGLLISLVLHSLLLLALFRYEAPRIPAKPLVIDINLANVLKTPQAAKKKQLVSPSAQTKEDAPPKETRYESDRESRVVREQIKRGDPLAGPVVAPAKKNLPPSPPAQQPRRQQNPNKTRAATTSKQNPRNTQAKSSLKYLRLDQGALLKSLQKTPTQKNLDERLNSAATGPSSPKSYQAFTRPQGAGARFFGVRGSSDYLPNLPDGDITLLNAKANRYAVFVRRVALQVFSLLRSEGWETLLAEEIDRIQKPALVTAVISLEGELVRVELLQDSGSSSFNRVVSNAAQSGVRDPHPPKSAALEDGNIHFLFQAQSWVKRSATRGRGRAPERRWLLLSTGLR